MQDRILGPLTMVQFIYAVIGGAGCYAIYVSALPRPIAFILIVPIALLVGCLIFVKINERPFLDFLVSILEFSTIPKQRIWHHENLSDMRVEVYHVGKQTGPAVQTKQISQEEISALANRLDKGQPKN